MKKQTCRFLLCILVVVALFFESLTPLYAATSTTAKAKEVDLGTDRIFIVRSAIDKNYVFDVENGSTANGAGVRLYKSNGTSAQRFRFHKNSDGTYTMLSVSSGKAVDVKGGSSAVRTRLQIYTSNNTKAQKFKVLKNADGTYSFRSALSDLAVDVSGGKAQNKQPLWMYKANNTKAQKFILEAASAGKSVSYEGSYVIRSAKDRNYVVDIAAGSTAAGANVQIYRLNGTQAQWFKLAKVGEYYRMTNEKSGMVLDVSGGKAVSGVNIWQYKWNKTNAQLWRVEKNVDGTLTFRPKGNEQMALSVAGGAMVNNANVQLAKGNNTSAQKFILDSSAKKVTSTTSSSSTSTKSTFPSYSVINSTNMRVLVNVIGAVESGGQVYGNKTYDSCVGRPWTPYQTSKEVTITIGWAQNYGTEGQRLLKKIFERDKAAFRKLDKDGSLEKMLKVNADGSFVKSWTASRYVPTSSQAKAIKAIISSAAGKAVQDEFFVEVMKPYISTCVNSYTKNVKAVMMFCEIAHLGGQGPARRIFNRIKNGTDGIKKGDYSLSNIRKSLAADKKDTSNNNQVGDALFDSRHDKCVEFINKYAKV